jgi:GntR family transcriptional regulator
LTRGVLCEIVHSVIPFRVQFRPGASLFEQTVYAAKRAMVSGQMRPGDAFPSVRALSKDLKINPNTAAKIVAQLINDGLLETHPGIGTVVAQMPDATHKERSELLGQELEQLVVEAKRLGVALDETIASLSAHWERLSHKSDAEAVKGGRKNR